MFFFFAASSYSWSERINVAITRFALDKADEYFKTKGKRTVREQLKSVFIGSRDYDLIDYPEQIGAWMNYVERAPFNFKAFNHWRFYSKSFGIDGITDFPDDLDYDNMKQNIKDAFGEVYSVLSDPQGSLRPYPFTLLTKIVVTGFLDASVPLHSANMFSKEFPNGDRNGRDFMILYKSKNMSLYDLWETGCGLDSSVTAEFNKDFWDKIDEFGKTLLDPSEFSYTQLNSYAVITDKLTQSYEYTKDNVYKGINQNTEVPESYIQKCQKYSKENMKEEYINLISLFTHLGLPQYKERTLPSVEDRFLSGPQGYYYSKPSDNSEKKDIDVFNLENDITESLTIFLQTVFVILVPTTFLLIWKKHCGTY